MTTRRHFQITSINRVAIRDSSSNARARGLTLPSSRGLCEGGMGHFSGHLQELALRRDIRCSEVVKASTVTVAT